MKILITGVNGFVGKNVYHSLSKKHEVFGIYNSGNALFDKSYKINLSNEEEALKALEETGIQEIDVIIHLASQTAGAQNINDLSVLTTNTAIAKTVALIAKKYNVKQLINLSSSSVYSNADGTYNEDSITDPSLNADCIYGLSKLNSEVILNYFLSKTNTSITHLRTAMIHGEGMNDSRLMPVITKEINEHNTVTLFGNGERLLNLVSVEKLVDYISFFINNPLTDIVNVCEETISTLAVAKRIISEKGNTETKIILKLEGNKSRFILDTTKLNQLAVNV